MLRFAFLVVLLFWKCVLASNAPKNARIEADNISFEATDTEQKTIAKGKVFIKTDEDTLKSDLLIVSQDKSTENIKMLARGDVFIKNQQAELRTNDIEILKSKDNFFKSRGNMNILLKEQKADINITNPTGNLDLTYLTGNSLYSETLIPGLDTPLNVKARFVEKQGEVFTTKKTVISSCDINCSPFVSPWIISASSMKYDKTKNVFAVKNAMFRLYGMPIFYLPYYSKSLKPQSVTISPPTLILLPTQTGFKPSLNIAPIGTNLKIVISPTFYGGANLNPINAVRSVFSMALGKKTADTKKTSTNLRQNTIAIETSYKKNEKFFVYVNSNYTKDFIWQETKQTLSQTKQNRYLVTSYSVFEPNSNNSLSVDRWDTSDRFFGLKYGGFWGNYLQNNFQFVNSNHDNYLLTVQSATYKTITQYNPANSVPQVQPNIDISFSPLPNVNLKTNFLNVIRPDGFSYKRLSQDIDINLLKTQTNYGQIIDINSHFQIDQYQIDRVYNTKQTSRLVPFLNINTSLPLIKRMSGSSFILEPKLSIYHTNYKNSNIIPNLDSNSGFLNDMNLFSYSSFSGKDLISEGTKIIYGANLSGFWEANQLSLNSFFGRVDYQNQASFDLPSDYVGSIYLKGNNFHYSGKILFNDEKSELNLFLNNLSYKPIKWLTVGMDTLILNKHMIRNPNLQTNLSSITPNIRFNFLKHYGLTINATNNLTLDPITQQEQRKWTNFTFIMDYNGKCSSINLGYTYNNLIVANSGTPKGSFIFGFLLKGI